MSIRRWLPLTLVVMLAFVLGTFSFEGMPVAARPTRPIPIAPPRPPRPHKPTNNMSLQTYTPGEGQIVTWIDGSTINGVQYYTSIGRSINIYNTAAPWETMMLQATRPPNGACLEVSVMHYRESGTNALRNYVNIVPWCAGQNNSLYFMDTNNATFLSKYARIQTGVNWVNWNYPTNTNRYNDETIFVTIKQTVAFGSGNCWSAYFYNYNTSVWDTMASLCGTPNEGYPAYLDGWTSIEEHLQANTVCGTLGTYSVVQARNLRVEIGINGSWPYASSSQVSYADSAATHCDPHPWLPPRFPTNQPYGLVMCADGNSACWDP